MEIEQTETETGVLVVNLDGRLDVAGAATADMPFSVIAGSYEKVVVDLQKVEFIASIGIRVLIQCARRLAQKGGGMVLLAPQETVERVLTTTGIDQLMPIVATADEAHARFA
ncbi:MAG: STAS domain-containing protein [Pseudomonadota bacterium]